MSRPASGDAPVVRTVVLDAVLGATRSVDRIEVRRIRMGPHVAAGPHVHNGPVVGSIEAGSVVFQVADGPETVLAAGDVFFEPEGDRISRFDAQAEGVTFLGYFPVSAGEDPELRPVD